MAATGLTGAAAIAAALAFLGSPAGMLGVGDRNHNRSRPQSGFFRDHIK
ncbi:hypothetical protein [Kamptonema sp. UHCC 0994]|nr:hypothetical protein [Kamptonema sp. UHCC 0994]MDF0556953.1 hypothetical protein [Kamptonema sp. UHCC 0994]